jgi:hypothetical protein
VEEVNESSAPNGALTPAAGQSREAGAGAAAPRCTGCAGL